MKRKLSTLGIGFVLASSVAGLSAPATAHAATACPTFGPIQIQKNGDYLTTNSDGTVADDIRENLCFSIERNLRAKLKPPHSVSYWYSPTSRSEISSKMNLGKLPQVE